MHNAQFTIHNEGNFFSADAAKKLGICKAWLKLSHDFFMGKAIKIINLDFS